VPVGCEPRKGDCASGRLSSFRFFISAFFALSHFCIHPIMALLFL
jgi:hypothetical protein